MATSKLSLIEDPIQRDRIRMQMIRYRKQIRHRLPGGLLRQQIRRGQEGELIGDGICWFELPDRDLGFEVRK